METNQTEIFHHYTCREGKSIMDKSIEVPIEINKGYQGSSRKKGIQLLILFIIYILSFISTIFYLFLVSLLAKSYYYSLDYPVSYFLLSVCLLLLWLFVVGGYLNSKVIKKTNYSRKKGSSSPYSDPSLRNSIKTENRNGKKEKKREQKGYATGGIVPKENWPTYLYQQDELYKHTYQDFISKGRNLPGYITTRPGTFFNRKNVKSVKSVKECEHTHKTQEAPKGIEGLINVS